MPPASTAVAVSSVVVDQTQQGVNSASVMLSTGSVVATTGANGTFSTTALPGTNTLTVSRGGTTLLTQSVTIGADGTIAEFPTSIPVTLVFGGPDTSRNHFVLRPPLTVTPTMPYSSQSVTVAYSNSDATAISVQYTGAGCGALMSAQLSGSSYSQTAQVGAAGSCQISATVTLPSGTQVFTSNFRVQATSIVLPAFSVVGADFVTGDVLPASATHTGTVAVTGVTGPGHLINGAIARLFVQTTDTSATANIVSLQVALHNGTGYYTVPAQLANGQLYFDVALDQDYFTQAATVMALPRKTMALTTRGRYRPADDSNTPSISFDVQTVDSQGNVSAPTVSTYPLTQVGSGTLQISLSWGTSDDLDLHVQEPSGFQIDFADLVAPDGGTLDLDSNAGCSVDNIDTENVTWPAPAKPTAGTYTVGVDYYANCSGISPSYQVTVNNCGKVTQFSGTFALGTDDAGNSVTEITKFDFQPCDGSEVAGTATYDDYAQTPTGFSPTATQLPIRFATIEVHRSSDGALLTSSSTDAAGAFDVHFTNTGTPGYYLKLVTANTTYVNQEVKNQGGADWYILSPLFDESANPVNTGVLMHATKDDAAAAFNVFDVGVEGAAAVKRYLHAVPTKISWLYYPAFNPPQCPDVSCYDSTTDTIDILGTSAIPAGSSSKGDSDVYDDIVLLHEYGHFVQKHFSADHSPGGDHSLENRYDPRLAWSEGSATFFALYARGTPEYLECTNDNIGSDYSITLPLDSKYPLGTETGSQFSNVGEVLVSAGMWAIAVPNNKPNAVFDAIGSLKPMSPTDESLRDFVGADFVDFLDGYFCTGNDDTDGNLKTAIVDKLDFQYDFYPVASAEFCAHGFPDALPPGVRPSAARATAFVGSPAQAIEHKVGRKVKRLPVWVKRL